MKRIIAFLTTITILASLLCGVMPVGADSADDAFSDKLTLLTRLNIIDSADANADKNTIVTRAEFAKYVAGIMGLGDFVSNELNYFDDVPADHWAKNAINALTQRGVISAAADRKFNPGAKITTHEALKMVLCAVGYGEYANIKGGYPTGYIFIARRLDITMKEEGDLTLYNAIQLLYSALLTPLYEQVVFTTDGLVSYEESAETLLSVNFGMYFMKGLVKSAEGLTIDNKGDEEEGFVRIGKVTYKTDLKLLDSVGRYCGFIVKDNKDTLDEIVILNKEELKDNQLEIDIDDFAGYNNNEISYYHNNATKSVRILGGSTVVKNGRIVDTGISAVLKKDGTTGSLGKGSIRLIDENSDGIYDYVLIFNYRNMIVESISIDTGAVFSSKVYGVADALVTSPKTVVLDPEKTEKKVVIRNAKGGRMNFTDLSIGAVLSVCESDKFVLATVSTSEITGTIFQTKSGRNNTTQIFLGRVESDASWYQFDEDFYNDEFAGGSKLAVGLQGKFYTDYRNTITNVKFTKATDWTYAYLVAYDQETLFDTTLKLKLFMEDGSMKICDAAKKVNVDGNTKSGASQVLTALDKTVWGQTLAAGEDNVAGQLIRVKINKDGKVTAIDTENTTAQEGTQTLKKNVDGETMTNQWYTNGFYTTNYGNTILRDANTAIFSVPEHQNLGSAEDKYFIKLDAGYFRSGSFDIDSYKFDMSSNYEDAIVVYGTPDRWGNKAPGSSKEERVSYIVDTVYKTLNSEGEEVYCMTAYSMGGLKYEMTAAEGYDFTMDYYTYTGSAVGRAQTVTTDGSTSAVAEPGDIVRFKLDLFGKINGGIIIYDCSRKDDAAYSITTGTIDNIESDTYESFWYGYVKSFDDGVIRMRRALPTADEYANNPHQNDYMAPKKAGGVLIVDPDAPGTKIQVGSDADIITADKLEGEATPVFMCCGGVGFFTGAIIYRFFKWLRSMPISRLR